jgi:hypothetical protein
MMAAKEPNPNKPDKPGEPGKPEGPGGPGKPEKTLKEKHLEKSQKMRARKALKRPDFIQRDIANQEVGLFCKKCGNQIQGMKPIGDEEIKRINNRDIILQQVRMGPLANYKQFVIACDDGSRHVSHVCTTCFPTLTLDDLDDILVADFDAALDEARRTGLVISESSMSRWIDRKAVGVEAA